MKPEIDASCPICNEHVWKIPFVECIDVQEPGQIAFCYHCKTLSVVTDDLNLRKLTQNEIVTLPKHLQFYAKIGLFPLAWRMFLEPGPFCIDRPTERLKQQVLPCIAWDPDIEALL